MNPKIHPNEYIRRGEYTRALEAYSEIPDEKLSLVDILNRASLRIRLGVDLDAGYQDLLACLGDETIARYAVFHNLGVYFEKVYEHTKAIEHYSNAIKENPGSVDSLINRGNNFHFLGKHQEAIEDYKAASNIDPKNPMLYFNTGNVYRNLGLYDESVFYYTKCLSIDKNYTAAKLNLANTYQMLGDSLAQEIILKEELEKPAIPYEYYHSYLFSLLHNQDHSPEYIFSEHKRVGKIIYNRVNREITLKRSENSIENKNKNKIKLGIISGDLRSHAVTKFFLPIFNLIDKNIFEIYVFSNHFKEDVFTQHYKFKADLFEKIYKKSDHEIAQMIFDKKLDILWDLSGHTGHSVNHLMALRLAKVQITGVGSPGTSGIPNIDYFYFPGDEKYALQIADQFTEKLLCTNLNTEFIVENNLPQLKPKPFESNGFLTFGIFVNSRKYTKQSWNFWISIFKNIPDSKIIFLGIGSDQQQRKIESVLTENDLDIDRFIFKPKVKYSEYLNSMNEVDVLLDAFPYTGGTSAISSILMGTLTIGVSGATLAALSGKMIHENFGITGNYPETIEGATQVVLKLNKQKYKISELQKKIRVQAKKIILDNRKKYGNELNEIFSSLVDSAYVSRQ